MADNPIKVLLVDDDEDDYVITREVISQIRDRRHQLDWADNYDAALEALQRRSYDICLLDYRLGGRTGLELLREARTLTDPPPMILLTGQDDHEIDLEAAKAGAADYLVKGQLNADTLERAIRYAIAGRRAEEILRRERDLIGRIMETSPVGIVVTSHTGLITFANRRAGEILTRAGNPAGGETASVLDWTETDMEGNKVAGRAPSLRAVLDSGHPAHDVHHAMQFRDGRRALLCTNAAPLFNAAGDIDGLVATIEDITERLALEAQLRQAQKMESIGQLAAGVAHDINNILTVIQGHAGLLLSAAAPGGEAARSLRQITAATARAAGFVRHLLAFSRKQIFRARILDLNAVLENLKTLLPQMLGDDIVLEICCRPPLPSILADAALIEQIVMNLAVNARDAMAQGGKLTLTTESADIDADYVRRHPQARAGRFVCLTVTDTGCGMSPAVIQRIFEPFFTTKDIGRGTGLGLATVFGIVRQHHGWLEVQSRVGAGSTFKVFLPEAGKSGDEAAASQTGSGAVRGGPETLLLVEDEISVLHLMQEVLQQYRYRVLIAASGAEGLRVWEENGGQVDLLLTDMVMPGGMSGGDLARELKRRKPALKIIYASGYSPTFSGRDFSGEDIVFLPKPYQPEQVARLIRNTLDGAENCPGRTLPVPTDDSQAMAAVPA
ncbi:MAG: response regulator [Verrucomicrobiota bacterium]|nr:response regulator [Verrucomicrobiota bacterium]